IYVLADGDSSCDPAVADKLIGRMVAANVDMVVGARGDATAGDGRAAEGRLLTRMASGLLGAGFSDIFSGYRVFSRRFAKSFTAASSGFALETELSIHALDLDIATAEIALPCGAGPAPRSNRISAARAGCRTLWTIAMMMRALRPLRFYGPICGLLALASLGLGYPVVDT